MYQVQIKGLQELPPTFQVIDVDKPIMPPIQQRITKKRFFALKEGLLVDIYGFQENDNSSHSRDVSRMEHHVRECLNWKSNFGVTINWKEIQNEKSARHHFNIFETKIHQWKKTFQQKKEFNLELEKQAYFIEINLDKISLYSKGQVGLFYGLTTISQLFQVNQNAWVIQEQEIFDYPIFEIRGVTDQQCHGQVGTVESIKREIEFLARYKNNTLGLNLEDVMLLDKWEELGISRGAFTPEEIKEITKHAWLYFMEIVPGFQGLGHLENFLIHEQFKDLAEFPGSNCLNLAKKGSREVLETWYEEICQKFNSTRVNACMDESYDFGKHASKEWINRKGGRARVFIDHVNWLYNILHCIHGKDVLMYHDSILKWAGKRLDEIPQEIKIIYWDYLNKPCYPKLKKLTRKGFFVIVSPSIINWSRPFPNITLALKNITNLARAGFKNGARGFLNSSWGDFCHQNLRAVNVLGFALGSSLAWNPTKFNEDDFSRAFFEDYLGMINGHLMWDAMIYLNKVNKGGTWNTPFFDRLWEHPLHAHGPSYPKKTAKKDLNLVSIARETFNTVKITVKKNKNILEVMDYILDVIEFNARKAIACHELQDSLKEKGNLNKISESSLKNLRELKQQNLELWERYAKIWMMNAKMEGLERIKRKMHHLDSAFEEILNKNKQANLTHSINPYIESNWITHPRYQNWKDLKQDTPVPFHFKKTFTLEQNYSLSKIQKAKIQVIAHTYAIIKINGKEVGDVISRFYLSPLVHDNAARIFDLKPLLKQGKNTIDIIAWEYSGSITSINAQIWLMRGDNHTKQAEESNTWIMNSDETWNVSIPKNMGKNMEIEEEKRSWEPARVFAIPPKFNGPIWKPNYFNDIPSKITHHLGEWEYKISMINMAVRSRTIQKIARWIVLKMI